jgi:hypothetical protein
MTSAQEHIRQARDLVRTAADHWDAANLSSIGNSVSVLESCVASLTAASKILNGSREMAGNEMRASLLGLRTDADRLQRLVDASAAFLRRLPGAQSADVELYQPGGSTRTIATGPDAWGLQG